MVLFLVSLLLQTENDVVVFCVVLLHIRPWEFLWMLMGLSFSDDGCFWRLLTFAVITTICIIWRPSTYCSQYALSSQIPQDEDDNHLEMVAPHFIDDDDFGSEGEEIR